MTEPLDLPEPDGAEARPAHRSEGVRAAAVRAGRPPAAKSGTKSKPPSLRLERQLLADGASCVIGIDEVGRGALAGPVAVGATILRTPVKRQPADLRDSKLLMPATREALVVPVSAWVGASAVGLASNEEIDAIGIIAALALAARRALEELIAHPLWVGEPAIVLDGSHDWLTPMLPAPATVRMRVKADRDCAIVAAASVLAKVHRDRMMVELHDEHPMYLWSSNKGYASAEHRAGLDAHGPSPWHRLTWLHERTDGAVELDFDALDAIGDGSPVAHPVEVVTDPADA